MLWRWVLSLPAPGWREERRNYSSTCIFLIFLFSCFIDFLFYCSIFLLSLLSYFIASFLSRSGTFLTSWSSFLVSWLVVSVFFRLFVFFLQILFTAQQVTWSPENQVWGFVLWQYGVFACMGLFALVVEDVPTDVGIQLGRQTFIRSKVVDQVSGYFSISRFCFVVLSLYKYLYILYLRTSYYACSFYSLCLVFFISCLFFVFVCFLLFFSSGSFQTSHSELWPPVIVRAWEQQQQLPLCVYEVDYYA